MLGKGAITFQELFQMKEFQGVQVLSGSSMQEKLAETEEKFVKEVAKYKAGDPLDPDTVIGPLINEKSFEKVKSYIQIGIEEGAKLVAGKVPEGCEKGYFVEPVVFSDVDNSMRIAQEVMFLEILVLQITRPSCDSLLRTGLLQSFLPPT